jgi:hypothetical protein
MVNSGNSMRTGWKIVYWTLFAAFLVTAALNMLHVHAGFLTNYLADITGPAWLYVGFRGLDGHPPRLFASTLGRTPEIAALSLFAASAATEVSQLFWPHGIFSGHYDPLDILAYAVGISACYLGEKMLPPHRLN